MMNNMKNADVTQMQKEALWQLARDAGAQADAMIHSWSGSDQAESEAYFCARAFYLQVANGVPIDVAFATQAAKWRAYAAEGNAKVAKAASKTGRGPSSGQSVISHRWAPPTKFDGMHMHLDLMARRCLALGHEPAPTVSHLNSENT